MSVTNFNQIEKSEVSDEKELSSSGRLTSTSVVCKQSLTSFILNFLDISLKFNHTPP